MNYDILKKSHAHTKKGKVERDLDWLKRDECEQCGWDGCDLCGEWK